MSHRLNQALCDALGVDASRTTAFTLRVRGGRLPTLTIQRLLLDQRELKPITERFQLRPLDKPQLLDLDALAATAREAVARLVEDSAARHLHDIKQAFSKARLHDSFRLAFEIRAPMVTSLKQLQQQLRGDLQRWEQEQLGQILALLPGERFEPLH